MTDKKNRLNKEVMRFLDVQKHPLRNEIEQLRQIILQAHDRLDENVKWNGPNYSVNSGDRITMKIQPPKNIQLIFHRGAKVKQQPSAKLIQDESGILAWKENDRAVVTFKNKTDVDAHKK